jgi:hypothetical protein
MFDRWAATDTNGWSLRAKFDGEFSGTTPTYAGTGTLKFTLSEGRGGAMPGRRSNVMG